MQSGFSTVLIVLGAVLGIRASVNAIELIDLPYGESDLEPYISAEVSPAFYLSWLLRCTWYIIASKKHRLREQKKTLSVYCSLHAVHTLIDTWYARTGRPGGLVGNLEYYQQRQWHAFESP